MRLSTATSIASGQTRPRPIRRPLTVVPTCVTQDAVWPFTHMEPVTVYERVIRELDRAEGDLWRNEPSYYRWAA